MKDNKNYGLYRGTVVENVDPLGLGRIKFRSWQPITTPIEELPYAVPCVPFGGGDNINGAGFYFIPEVGSQVWILHEDGDSSYPVWIGSSFYSETGRQNIPIEAKPTSIEPSVRIIKSTNGHKLILDDRSQKPNGDPVDDVSLLTYSGTGLILNDPTGSGRGIRLGFGTSSGELKLTREGALLKSNKGSGLFINDTYDMVRLSDAAGDGFLQISNKQIIGQAPNGINITTTSQTVLEADTGINIKSIGGVFSVKASNIKLISGSDIIMQTGGNFNVNSSQYNLTGQLGTNFWLDLPIPGIPGTFQGGGNIVMTTSGGGILLRNGLPIPGFPPLTSATFTTNDGLMPSLGGRLAIGDMTSGNVLLEGRLGGIFISGTPIILPGAGVGGGRVPTPFAPIIPTGFPAAPQPAVLGGNLYQLLTQQSLAINTFLSLLIASAPAFATSPIGPCILSPAVVAAITTLQATLTTLQQTFYGPSPTPTGILSSLVFID